ncbi:MAG: sugar transferase [Chloroflexi bacterium]|nr:MAG: sugar transferase [Chloroflexota bacterium]
MCGMIERCLRGCEGDGRGGGVAVLGSRLPEGEGRMTSTIPEPVETDRLKEGFDRVLAGIGLVVTAPLFGLVALAIKLDGWLWPEDRGPVLHREQRISAGQPFTLLKFRTMRVRAIEEVRRRGLTVKYLEREGRGHTRVGRYLRRWYLDELPQLLNILRGEMSFVGPRPPAPFEYERELAEGIVRKRLARAGLVGLQQVHKGRTKSFDEEIALDYAYVAQVRRMRPWRRLLYDVGILLRSLRVLLEGKGL